MFRGPRFSRNPSVDSAICPTIDHDSKSGTNKYDGIVGENQKHRHICNSFIKKTIISSSHFVPYEVWLCFFAETEWWRRGALDRWTGVYGWGLRTLLSWQDWSVRGSPDYLTVDFSFAFKHIWVCILELGSIEWFYSYPSNILKAVDFLISRNSGFKGSGISNFSYSPSIC